MPIPKPNFTGQRARITMMELRASPGEVVESVRNGMTIDIEKNGKPVAVLAPSDANADTVIHSNGSITGPVPLTYRRNLGSGLYGD